MSRTSLTPASLPRVSSDGPSVVVGSPSERGGEDVIESKAPSAIALVHEPPTSLDPVVTSAEPSEDALPSPDEISSIPPVVETAAIGDEDFFEAGERITHAPVEDDEWDHPQVQTLARKSLPHVVERRQRFSRVVKWVAGGAAMLCALAAARALAPAHTPPAAAATKIEAPAPLPEAKVEAPKVDVPKAPVLEAAPVPTPTPAAVEAADPDAAKVDKKLAQRALERGKLADAIEAGERSVASDPTDAEAWLILGASYQEKGQIAEAKRCYRSCIDQGKRGSKSDCAAMLR